MWPNTTDDDLRLLDSFLSPLTSNEITNISFSNRQHSQSSNNNNNSQLINTIDEKQLIGPLGSNL